MSHRTITLRHLVTCLDGRRVPLNREQRAAAQGPVPYWGAGGVLSHVDRALFDEPLVLLGEDGAPFFEPGRDVAFFVEGPVWVNNHIHVLRPSPNVEPRFLTYALNAVDYGRYITGSTRDKLTQDEMRAIEVPYPSLDEQVRIADFLDATVASMIKLIELRLSHGALLAERRQARLAEQFGVTSNVFDVLTGTGCSKHGWPTRRLSTLLTSTIAGGTPSTDDPSNWATEGEKGVAWITIGDMTERGTTEHTERRLTAGGLAESRLRLAPPGTVLLAMYASVGKTTVTAIEAVWNQAILGLVPTPDLAPKFLVHWLELVRPLLPAIARSSTQDNLNADQVRSLRLPVPALEEQMEVCARLADDDAWAEQVTRLSDSQISLLRERISSTVAAAVSGRLDVTGVGTAL